MTDHEDRWGYVAECVRGRMRELGMRKQVELVDASGLSDATVRVFMTGKLRGPAPNAASRLQIADALWWEEGAVDRALQGFAPLTIEEEIEAIEEGLRELNHASFAGEPPESALTELELSAAHYRAQSRKQRLAVQAAERQNAHAVVAARLDAHDRELSRLRDEVAALRQAVSEVQADALTDDAEQRRSTPVAGGGAASPQS